MIATKNIAAAIATLLALSTTATAAHVDSLRQLDSRVVRLERQATGLVNFLETQEYRSGTSRRLVRQSSKIARQANHIHVMILEAPGGSRRSLWRHIQSDVKELDRLMREARATFAEMRRDMPVHHVGRRSPYGVDRRSPYANVSYGYGWSVYFGTPRATVNRGHHYSPRSPRRQMMERVEWKLSEMQRTLRHLKRGMWS